MMHPVRSLLRLRTRSNVTVFTSSKLSTSPPPPGLNKEVKPAHRSDHFDAVGNDTTKGWNRRKMRSWEIHSFGGPGELRLNEHARVPIIKSPFDLLIEVKAASVNPIDTAMTRGYGADVMSALRRIEKKKIPLPWKDTAIDFPLTFGRDFAGIVRGIGSGVNTFRVGDEVYGVLNFTEHGSHADYLVANRNLIQRKPSFLSFTEAASIPYVGLTCWSAVNVTGNYCDLTNKKFLILGGSGGVGTFGIQYLKSYGAFVVSTGSTDSLELMMSLGSNGVADYKSPDYEKILQSYGPYDCILNFSGPRNDLEKHYSSLLKPVTGQYITLSPPALNNFDQHGFVGGMLKNAADLFSVNLSSLGRDKVVTKWAFFVPAPPGFRSINDLVGNGRIKPVVQKVLSFKDLPRAYELVESGHLRGKVVLEM